METADLLLVGLVRSGIAVRAIQLGSLHCDRVTAQGSADTAIRRLAEVDEAKVRLKTAVKPDDGFFATFFVSTWSPYLVRLAARLKLTPNTVTGISVALAALAAVWYSEGTRSGRLIGSGLLLLSFVLDCVDGQLARYTRSFSALGAWSDAMADRLKEYLVYVGLALGYVASAVAGADSSGIWPLAVAAMIVQVLKHTIDFSYSAGLADARRIGASWAKAPRSLLDSDDMTRADQPEAKGVLKLARRLERESFARWVKRIIPLPIGERMALIAVTAGVFDARITFLALLSWGGFALLYQLAGRIARSSQ